jgi:hypothetical protein
MATAGSGWTFPMNQYHARQQRWRVAIERQIGTHDVVEASYEGTYTSNLTYNQSSMLGVPSTFYNFTQTRSDTNANWLGTGVANPFYGETTGATVPTTGAQAIYPASVTGNSTLWTWMATNTLFTSPTRTRSTLLYSTPNGNILTPQPRFHSRTLMLEVSYNHRFSHGLSANIGYTHMETKNGNSYFQGWNPDDPTRPQVPYWNPIAGGAPHRVVATWVYDLPFGTGRSFVHNKYASLIVGGWRISGAYNAQQGGLLGFGNVYFYGDPNSIKLANPTPSQYFNTAGCVSTTALSPGDTVVGTGACTSGFEKRTSNAASSYQYRFMPANIAGLRAPGYHEWDVSIARSFKIRERLTLDTRLDVLNILNHSILNGPDMTPTNSTFGQITGASASPNRFPQIKANLHW